ncbi:MAG: HAD hydrolase-like protein, partial [Woeseiaceae bacterium]
LAHASGLSPVVLGKPARPFFETALAMLDVSAGETLIVGDDIQGDIAGAQAAGLSGVLVRTGKFQTSDLEGDIWRRIRQRRGRDENLRSGIELESANGSSAWMKMPAITFVRLPIGCG